MSMVRFEYLQNESNLQMKQRRWNVGNPKTQGLKLEQPVVKQTKPCVQGPFSRSTQGTQWPLMLHMTVDRAREPLKKVDIARIVPVTPASFLQKQGSTSNVTPSLGTTRTRTSQHLTRSWTATDWKLRLLRVTCPPPVTKTDYTSTSGCGPCKSAENDKGCKQCDTDLCNKLEEVKEVEEVEEVEEKKASATSITVLLVPLLAIIYTLF